MRTIFFLLVLLQVNIANAGDRELASKGDDVRLTINDSIKCDSTVNVKITTSSADYFVRGAETIKILADTARAILGLECSRITKIEFTGVTDDVIVFRAESQKSSNWVLESHQEFSNSIVTSNLPVTDIPNTGSAEVKTTPKAEMALVENQQPSEDIADVKATELLPSPGLEGRTTWRIMYGLGAQKYLGFITLNISNNKVTGRIDTVSPQTGAYELVGETTKDGGVILKSSGVIASAKATFRHNAQPVNLTGQIGSDGITLEGKVEGVKAGNFKALKFNPDTRPPRPDGLFVKEYQRNKGPDAPIETCRNIFNWLSEESNESIDYHVKIPTQIYSQSFYKFFGMPYDQCTQEQRITFSKFRNNCSRKLRNSGTVDDSKLLSKYQKNISPFGFMMSLNGPPRGVKGSYPVFPEGHNSFTEQPIYHNFLKYFHYVGLRDGKAIMDQLIRTVENKKELEVDDLKTIENLLTELITKPSKNDPPLTKIAFADIGDYKKRLNLLLDKHENQQIDAAVKALASSPGTPDTISVTEKKQPVQEKSTTATESNTKAKEQSFDNPDINNRQDIIEHLVKAAQSCEALPEGLSARNQCIDLCLRFSRRIKGTVKNTPLESEKEWEQCKRWYDGAFYAHKEVEKKKQQVALKVSPVKATIQAKESVLKAHVINTENRISSNPAPNNKQDVIVHLLAVAKACEGLPDGQPGKEECITLCSRLAKEKKSFDFGPDINLREWISCKETQDVAFGVSHQDFPVNRNDYAWGYNESDSYWYGGWVLDIDERKILLAHYDEQKKWYPVKDIRKFVPKGRIEVNKNGKYYQAEITGIDVMNNVLVRYIGNLPQNLQKLQAKPKKQESMSDFFARNTKDPRYDLERLKKQAQTVRKRMGLDDDMENVSIKRIRRASVGDNSTWPELLATIIKDNQADIGKVISYAQLVIEESLFAKFRDFADNYFESWMKEQVDFHKENLPEAPLLGVAEAAEFVESLPDPSQIEVLEKVKKLLQTASDEIDDLIEQRITALESLAIKAIRESGTGYTDVETIYEIGLTSAEEFKEAGYVKQSQKLIEATTEYINQLLKSNLQQFKQELKSIEFTDESYAALEEQVSVFEKLSTKFKGLKVYQEAAVKALLVGKGIICENALKEAKVKSSDFNKQIYVGEKQLALRDLACDLRERGHAVFEFSKKSFSKSYVLGIEETNGTTGRFLLKPDKTMPGKGLKVIEIMGDEEHSITQTEWLEYITNLAYEPPIFKKIDKIAHPEDLQNPANLAGITDEELVELPSEEVAELIDEGLSYAKQAEEPRYLFALGRAEWLHGDDERAFEILSLAADNGSAAAYAYLARITDDFNQSAAFLKRAIKGGFKPAKEWLEELKQFQREQEEEEIVSQSVQVEQTEDVNFNSFSLGYMMRAFYEGNTSHFTKEPVGYLTYVSAVNDALNDQSMLFMMENPKVYIRELDPNLSFDAGRKMLTSRAAVIQSTAVFGTLLRTFQVMAETRRSGGSIEDEVVAANKEIYGGGQNQDKSNPMLTVLEVKNRGLKDGKILAFMFEDNPEAFRKIYKGMQKFVREQM